LFYVVCLSAVHFAVGKFVLTRKLILF